VRFLAIFAKFRIFHRQNTFLSVDKKDITSVGKPDSSSVAMEADFCS